MKKTKLAEASAFCGTCAHFQNNPVVLEKIWLSLNSMSSGLRLCEPTTECAAVTIFIFLTRIAVLTMPSWEIKDNLPPVELRLDPRTFPRQERESADRWRRLTRRRIGSDWQGRSGGKNGLRAEGGQLDGLKVQVATICRIVTTLRLNRSAGGIPWPDVFVSQGRAMASGARLMGGRMLHKFSHRRSSA